MSVIDLNERRYFKQLNDDFYLFAQKIEKHFQGDVSNLKMIERMIYCYRYVTYLCRFTLAREENKHLKKIVIHYLKKLIKSIEKEN